MKSENWAVAPFTSPNRKDASAFPVFAAPRLLVMSGEKVRLPEEPRSRLSSFAPARYSPPILYACVPPDHDIDSRTWVSLGYWNRETVGEPSDAVPKFVVAAEPVADCAGP